MPTFLYEAFAQTLPILCWNLFKNALARSLIQKYGQSPVSYQHFAIPDLIPTCNYKPCSHISSLFTYFERLQLEIASLMLLNIYLCHKTSNDCTSSHTVRANALTGLTRSLDCLKHEIVKLLSALPCMLSHFERHLDSFHFWGRRINSVRPLYRGLFANSACGPFYA